MNVVPYLHFGGECAAAMTFYQACLGGDLDMQRVGDTPMAEQTPEDKLDHIMHSSLTVDGRAVLFASDMMGQDGLNRGNDISVCLDFTTGDDLRAKYTALAEGGKVGHEPKTEFWGGTYADLEDKFGVRWMFNHQEEPAAS